MDTLSGSLSTKDWLKWLGDGKIIASVPATCDLRSALEWLKQFQAQ